MLTPRLRAVLLGSRRTQVPLQTRSRTSAQHLQKVNYLTLQFWQEMNFDWVCGSVTLEWKHLEREMPVLDWSQCPAVERVPGKVSGAWVLRGTRMPVATIFENLQAGANIDDILEWFDGLDREQVKAVIDFAARSLEEPAPAR